MTDQIFISYSREDSDFAHRLADDLKDAGFKIWIDRSLQVGEDWEETIEIQIRGANDVIVILSPNAVSSKWVQHEGSIAYGLGKQMYPVLMEDIKIEDHPLWAKKYQYHSFVGKEYQTAFDALVTALTPPNPIQDLLDLELQAYRDHGDLIGETILRVIEESSDTLKIDAEARELIDKSRERIENRERRERELLEGREAAEKLRLEEQERSNQKLRRRAVILTVVLVVAVLLAVTAAIFGGLSFQSAKENALLAESNATIAAEAQAASDDAQEQAQIARAHQLIAQGQVDFEAQPLQGIRLVLEGVKLAPQESRWLLTDVTEDLFKKGRILKLDGLIDMVFPSTDGSRAVISYADPGLPSELIDPVDGSPVETLTDRAVGVEFSPNEDGTYFIVSYGENRKAELRRTSDGKLINELPPRSTLRYWEFSPDPGANYLLLHYLDERKELLESATGSPAALTGKFRDVKYSSDEDATHFLVTYADALPELRRTSDGGLVYGLQQDDKDAKTSPDPAAKYLLVTNQDRDLTLYHTDSGQLIHTFPEVNFYESYFSHDPEASYLVTRSGDYTKLYHTDRARPMPLGSGLYTTVKFSPDPEASYFTVEYGDGKVDLHRSSDARPIATLSHYSARVEFSPGSESCYIVVRDDEFPFQTTLLFKIGDRVREIITLDKEGHGPGLTFSPDPASKYFVASTTAPGDELYRSSDGTLVRTFQSNQGIRFSLDPEAAYLVLKRSDDTFELMQTEGETVELAGQLTDIEFVPDSEAVLFVVHYEDGRAELWAGEGEPRLLTELGLGLEGYSIDPARQRMLIWYTYGSAYLLDLDWLVDIGGDPSAFSAEELERFACQRLFVAPFFDAAAFSDSLGGEAPRTCR